MDDTSKPTTPRRLTRSVDDRMLGGVCGGIADYLDADPTIIRLVAVLLTVFGGSGIIAYAAAWLLIPEAGSSRSIADDVLHRHEGEAA